MVEQPVGYEDFILRVGTGLLVGALIGLERERAQIASRSKKSVSIPGFRTMGFIGLYGSLTGYIGVYLLPFTGPFGTMGFIILSYILIALIVLLYAYARTIKIGAMGFTTYVVMFITFTAGVMTGMGLVLEGASAGVVGGLLLALKEPVVRIARAIKYQELIALMEVAAVFLVLGPTVYYLRSYITLIDIFQVYLFFAAILALSFSGYIAARIWGVKGYVSSMVLGSLVNSEAVVASIASRTSTTPNVIFHSTITILGVMQARIAVLALYALLISGYLKISPLTLEGEAPILIMIMTLASTAAARMASITLQREAEHITPKAPLDWNTAIKGALAFLLLTLIINSTVGATGGYTGELAVLALSIIGGFISANATLLSLAGLLTTLGPDSFSVGVLGTALGASLNKVLYARAIGAPKPTLREIARASIAMSLLPSALLALYYGTKVLAP
ncbi:MAG: DUF4010 domain-containing protein [Aeropyrum sp.]|nr:DUF4010 domain-containing protein [Aeropyrum sp.]MCE4616864.1 DUF4010 domain-containing protein [Aeropyrum sp.]